METTIDLDQATIDVLREMRGQCPIVAKYILGAGTPAGVYFQIILTETFGISVSAYSGMGMISDGVTVPVMMAIVPEDGNSAYEGKWTATLIRLN